MMFSFSAGQTDNCATADAQTASEIARSAARRDVSPKFEQLQDKG